MTGPPLKGQRLVALCLCGCLLFNFPLLSLFTGSESVWGIPLVYFYVFSAWAVIIALMALIIERKDS